MCLVELCDAVSRATSLAGRQSQVESGERVIERESEAYSASKVHTSVHAKEKMAAGRRARSLADRSCVTDGWCGHGSRVC